MKIFEVIKHVVGKRALEYKLIMGKKYEKSLVRARTWGITYWDSREIYICKKRIKMDARMDNIEGIVKWIGNTKKLSHLVLFVVLHEYAHVTHYLTGHLDPNLCDDAEKNKYSKKIENLADKLAAKWYKKLKRKGVI